MTTHAKYRDRRQAGFELAEALLDLHGSDSVVLGLPRGGVPVAAAVAEHLGLPLDVIVVRKLGVPTQPELGFGAIGEDGARVLNAEIVRTAGVTSVEIERVEQRERTELERRVAAYRLDRPAVALRGRTVVLVDDGIATGSTMAAACATARERGASRVVVAVPVAPPGWEQRLAAVADVFVCPWTPEPYLGVGQWYEDFTQTTDETVTACLSQGRLTPGPATRIDGTWRDDEIEIPASGARLAGHLTVPAQAHGLVVVPALTPTDRRSPHFAFVVEHLERDRLATLRVELCTGDEPGSGQDDVTAADRLRAVTRWAKAELGAQRLPVAYLGIDPPTTAVIFRAAADDPTIIGIAALGGLPPTPDAPDVPVFVVPSEPGQEAQRSLRGASHSARDWLESRFASVGLQVRPDAK